MKNKIYKKFSNWIENTPTKIIIKIVIWTFISFWEAFFLIISVRSYIISDNIHWPILVDILTIVISSIILLISLFKIYKNKSISNKYKYDKN